MGVIRFSQTGLRDIVLLGSDYGWSSLPCLRPCLECWFAHNVSVGLFSGRRQVLVGLENDRMWYGVEPCRVTALECFAALGIRTRSRQSESLNNTPPMRTLRSSLVVPVICLPCIFGICFFPQNR